jgi:hypothetical protein
LPAEPKWAPRNTVWIIAWCCIATTFGLANACAPIADRPRESEWIRARRASAADLTLDVWAGRRPAGQFPAVRVTLTNRSPDPILVDYHTERVTVHIGDFVLHPPPDPLQDRRQLLDGGESMVIELPPGPWQQPDAPGGELLTPDHLPAGPQRIWATFDIPGPPTTVLESAHLLYASP